jgi:hypothetical protein
MDRRGSTGGTSVLLADPPKLEIKLDERKMVSIKNAVVKNVGSPEELMTLFSQGNQERHIGATKMNAESSRSHSIFAIMVRLFVYSFIRLFVYSFVHLYYLT